jgi:transitional endoplasmic reticulum ATPase
LLAIYVVGAVLLAMNKDFSDKGPLSFHEAGLSEPLADALPLAQATRLCMPDREPGNPVKIVGAVIQGRPYYACYEVYSDGEGVFDANVVDARDGVAVKDVQFLKASGAWPWLGVVKKESELVVGAVALAAIFATFYFYYGRLRPGQPTYPVKWWENHGLLVTLGTTLPVVGWVLPAALRGLSQARKQRVVLQSIVLGAGIWLSIPWMIYTEYPETWGMLTLSILTVGYVAALLAGRAWLRPEGFGLPEDVLTGKTSAQTYFAGRGWPLAAPTAAGPVVPGQTQTPAPGGRTVAAELKVTKPDELPSFRDVGGMSQLKKELQETFGLMLAFAGEAEKYRIHWNGLLLHGSPGVGKTFMARAAAGEFGLNFIHVTTGELVSPYSGESAKNVEAAFRFAAQHIPCILFFDEFDSVALSRADLPDRESRLTVNQLLQSLEEWRKVQDLIVVAATNSLESLDEAVVRPGRFDRHVRIDLPDFDARKAVFTALLRDRPSVKGLDLDELARRSEGQTPAALARAVESAAIAAFRQATASGDMVEITMEHLLNGLSAHGGMDRPTVEEWTWDKLILPESTKKELMQFQLMVEDPERARMFGVDPPTGVLLTGPPGTGKTTIAKVLAAQAKCSFYPVSSATITSKWLGESEKNLKKLFQRARENRPSIIFIDEIDAIASTRGEWGSYDREVNQLLSEMDGIGGQRGVFVLAATNRPDQLDPALLRGGRLSRVIDIGLPGRADRRKLLELYSAKMPLVGVDFDELAATTEGRSPADIKALCQQAALQGMMQAANEAPQVTRENFLTAIKGGKPQAKSSQKEGGSI